MLSKTPKKAPRKRTSVLGQEADVSQSRRAKKTAAGQQSAERQGESAGGGTNQRKRKSNLGHAPFAPQQAHAETAAAGHLSIDPQDENAGGGIDQQVVDDIRDKCRWRRYWMKVQHKLDRALESQIRRMETDWEPSLPEKEREKYNKEALAIIAKARKGEGKSHIVAAVLATDAARDPADKLEAQNKAEAARLAMQLPVYAWIETVAGAGEGGLATIIGETGDLTDLGHPGPSTPENPYEGPQGYTSPAKIWKRLGFAPYDGFAGSTWKREKWRPRDLTKQEWIENPFSGAKYALIQTIADSLFRKQKEGYEKDPTDPTGKRRLTTYKSGTKYGEPLGPFGEVYVKRRLHTDVTQPEWSAGHSHADALRIMMKEFLKALWKEWNRIETERKGVKE